MLKKWIWITSFAIVVVAASVLYTTNRLPKLQMAEVYQNTITPSAIIIDQFVRHSDSTTRSCKDTSKCNPDSTDSSEKASVIYITKPPYSISRLPVMQLDASEVTTRAYAESYGITGRIFSGRLDLNNYSGYATLITTGPNGSTQNFDISRDNWTDWQPIGAPKAPSDNVKGADKSANWYRSVDGKDVYGIWIEYTYSGDSRKLLIVKGDPNRKYNVVLSASARSWHLNTAKDSGPDFNPAYFINGDEVFCPSIYVYGKKLNYDCKREYTLVPGVYDVTPSTKATPRYFYTINVISIEDAGPATSSK